MITRPLLLASIAFLLGFHGCCITCTNVDEEEDPSVSGQLGSIPTTVEDFREQDDPPARVATVEHVVVEPGSSDESLNCGHAGPACLVMLPFTLLPQQPQEFDVATLTVDGETVQEVRYGADGRLVTGRFVEGETVRYAGSLDLHAILERPIVELGRARLDADGVEPPTEPTPLLEQFDFSARYLEAFAETVDG